MAAYVGAPVLGTTYALVVLFCTVLDGQAYCRAAEQPGRYWSKAACHAYAFEKKYDGWYHAQYWDCVVPYLEMEV